MGNQTSLGKAFEFACFQAIFKKAVSLQVPIQKMQNPALNVAETNFQKLDPGLQTDLINGALTSVNYLFSCEPHLADNVLKDSLIIGLQDDKAGQTGDVRDILLKRKGNEESLWQIGVSCKHNHTAVKHPRVGFTNIDFISNWTGKSFGVTETYKKDIEPVCKIIQAKKGRAWTDAFPDRNAYLYDPINNAVKDELLRQAQSPSFSTILFDFLIGTFDFYKICAFDKQRVTQLLIFNMNNSLNKSTVHRKPSSFIKQTPKPNNILSVGKKSDSTLYIQFDLGWLFSMRLHTADGKITTSLKYDVRLDGVPSDLLNLSFPWF